jgi:hypothetical protein
LRHTPVAGALIASSWNHAVAEARRARGYHPAVLRHAGAVLGIVMVGCGSGNGPPADAIPPADAATDAAPDAADAAADRAPDIAAASLGASLVTDPQKVDFGVFYLGCPRATSHVTVTNLGPGTTGDLLVTIDKPFKLGLDECSARALLVAEDCQIEVRVAPEEAGEAKGTLRVWSSPSDLVEVKLAVTAADVSEVVPAFLLSPASLEFGPLAVGQSATQKVTVSVPAGFRPVPKVTASLTGPDFTVGKDGCAGATIQPGKSCEIEIAFHPTSAGDKSAALSLSAPEPCPPFQSQVSLKGKAQ